MCVWRRVCPRYACERTHQLVVAVNAPQRQARQTAQEAGDAHQVCAVKGRVRHRQFVQLRQPPQPIGAIAATNRKLCQARQPPQHAVVWTRVTGVVQVFLFVRGGAVDAVQRKLLQRAARAARCQALEVATGEVRAVDVMESHVPIIWRLKLQAHQIAQLQAS